MSKTAPKVQVQMEPMQKKTTTEDSLPLQKKEIPPRSMSGYCFDEKFLLHFDPSSEHIESPNRVLEIFSAMRAKGYIDKCCKIPSRAAVKSEVCLVHSEDHFNSVESTKGS